MPLPGTASKAPGAEALEKAKSDTGVEENRLRAGM